MDFTTYTRTQLIALCKERGLRGYSSKTKEQLVACLAPSSPDVITHVTDSDATDDHTSPTDDPLITTETSPIQLVQGDCLEVMRRIPSNSVHLILCDLPYGSTRCKWDSIIDIDRLWAEYKRILVKPTGVVLLFSQQPFTTKLISANYDWFKYTLIWKKNKTTQFLLANYRPMKCTEDVCVFSPGGAAAASRTTGNMTYNPQGLVPVDIVKKNSAKRIGKMLNQKHHLGENNKLLSGAEYKQTFTNYPTEILEFDIESDTIHETQKPVPLIEYLIRTYSNEGDVVLDNTMGSGTTGIGCVRCGRSFIGIELDPRYFQLSKDRIATATATATATPPPAPPSSDSPAASSSPLD
jgi:site-specific DNA-methyltransferase (adenine-specific)